MSNLCLFHFLQSRKQGTSWSFNGTAHQRTVRARSWIYFVARRRTFMTASNSWLPISIIHRTKVWGVRNPNILDFSPVDYRILAVLQQWVGQHLMWESRWVEATSDWQLVKHPAMSLIKRLIIGVARILSVCALFFPPPPKKKVDDLFSRRPQNTR